MTDRTIFVYVDWEETTHFVGRLFVRDRKGRESASFEYDPSWLTNPSKFALEPALTLHPAPFHTPQGRALFGTFGDSAPDRWGRILMRRSNSRQARQENRSPHTLQEIDYLLRVDDECRQGALRFAEEPGGLFLAMPVKGKRIPLLVDLPRLLTATTHVIQEDENDEDIKLLFAPGSSLGGARPKASVRSTDGTLMIAKFPHPEDNIDLPAWESVALSLAEKAGLNVAKHKLLKVADRSVILLDRFDRQGERRIPFLSAMSFLGASDNESHSYLEVADALRRYSGHPIEDLKELWMRIVLSILVSNTDDHLRNHGLLLPDLNGWRLSPAYDINPTPLDIKARRLSLAIDQEDNSASIKLALIVAGRFGLTQQEAKAAAKNIAKEISGWVGEAKSRGIKSMEIERMSSAFEHDELRLALSF
jgi:serine/threonine-protein kinase HipA